MKNNTFSLKECGDFAKFMQQCGIVIIDEISEIEGDNLCITTRYAVMKTPSDKKGPLTLEKK